MICREIVLTNDVAVLSYQGLFIVLLTQLPYHGY